MFKAKNKNKIKIFFCCAIPLRSAIFTLHYENETHIHLHESGSVIR